MDKDKNKTRYEKLKLSKKWIFIGLSIWIVSFFVDIWPIVFITIFTVANTAMLSFKKYFDPPIDIELSTMAAVLITIKYGLVYGLIAAFFTKFIQMMYIKKIKMAYFFMMSSYMVAALFANFFSGFGVVNLGIIVSVISNIYLAFVRKFLLGYSPIEIMGYGITNIIFNIVLFIGFSEMFLFIMI